MFIELHFIIQGNMLLFSDLASYITTAIATIYYYARYCSKIFLYIISFNSKKLLGCRYYCLPHIIDRVTEAHKGKVTPPWL